jgi:hypothetical protein
MNRAQRVKVITESAALLAKRDWPEIDLILTTFGFTAHDWGPAMRKPPIPWT